MAETPSMKRILDVYYALLAQGVQRYPRPLEVSKEQSSSRNQCLFLVDFGAELVSFELRAGQAVSAPAIIARLIERLPWRDQVSLHMIFEAQPKTPQLHPMNEDVIASVCDAFAFAKPDRCVCFGWRAAHACSVALGVPFAIPTEAYDAVEFVGENERKVEILALPDVRELEAFPEWRTKVWESLLAFGPVR